MTSCSLNANAGLEAALELASTQARLLVVSDFDGTISNFTNTPNEATLDPLARIALRKLSELPNTYVSVISGRSLADLSGNFQHLERVRLVGSHGHEFDIDKIAPLTSKQQDLMREAKKLVGAAVEQCPGSNIEVKPHGVAFHFRGLYAIPVDKLSSLRNGLKRLGDGIVRDGNMVLEYCVVSTDKGDALTKIQEQIGPTITLFMGDDLTDEAAFKRLSLSDISIKVGQGDTAAKFRVHSTEQAVQVLIQIAERRTEWMRALPGVAIDQHLFLSDLRTAALIDRRGNLNWLCTPRLDGTPLFGALVGGPGAGHFRISGTGEGTQTYIGNTLIGQTAFANINISDFLDCSAGRAYQRAGRSDLVRIIEGSGQVDVEFAPKFNFGRVPTRLSGIKDGLRIDCGQQRLVMFSPGWEWTISREGLHDVARSQLVLDKERKFLVLLIGTSSASAPMNSIDQMLADTSRFWEMWLATLKLPKNYSALVARSALVLRGLCYGPTGAIAAAPTTSLPETIGGVRNWDYRYCWPRDACLAASALVRLNATGPAMRLLDWILGVVFDSEEEQFLAPLYTVTGRSVLGEAEVPEALGYRGSRPVRIGNLAAEQLQLDSLAPIAELMWKLAERGASLTTEHLQLAQRLVSLIQSRWNEPDSGIWEVRGAPHHYVHSKLMCWYTVQCCARVSSYLGTERSDWLNLLSEIRKQIETEGFNESLQSYVSAYDIHDADASLLWIILTGFHPPSHQRSRGTLNFIKRCLVHEQGIYRYHFDDSIHGQEGEFIICRCWLIEALVMMGELKEAQVLFEELVARITPLGLLSEQWDSKENCALGNYPQAYSHLGFINAACALDRS